MPKIYKRECDYCKKPYKNWSERFCSQGCYFNALKTGRTEAGFKKGHKFYGESVKGKHCNLSHEVKEKHRQRMILNKKQWSKMHTKEVIQKSALSRRGKRTGSKSNFWQGGKTELGLLIRGCAYYNEWRLRVFQRDNFTCQECGESGVQLNADHIKRFSEILGEFMFLYPNKITSQLLTLSYSYAPFWDISNGRTLCVECHRKTFTYGRLKKVITQL